MWFLQSSYERMYPDCAINGRAFFSYGPRTDQDYSLGINEYERRGDALRKAKEVVVEMGEVCFAEPPMLVWKEPIS